MGNIAQSIWQLLQGGQSNPWQSMQGPEGPGMQQPQPTQMQGPAQLQQPPVPGVGDILQHIFGQGQPQASQAPPPQALNQIHSGSAPDPAAYGQDWSGRHPGWNNFLTAVAQGFASKLAPGAFQQSSEDARLRSQQAIETQRMEMQDAKTKADQVREQLQLNQKQQLDAWERGATEVKPLPDPMNPLGVIAPEGAIKIGDKYYKLPETEDTHKGQTAVPAANPIAKKFLEEGGGKPGKDGLVYMDSGLLKYYGETAAQQAKDKDEQRILGSLDEQNKRGHDQVSQYFQGDKADPLMKSAWTNLFDTAKETDRKSGNTSEMKQAWSKWLDFMNTNSPEAKESKRAADLQNRKDLMTFANALHEGPKPDDQDIAYWTKQVQQDAKNYGLIKNKTLQTAVNHALAIQGLDVNQIDAQTRDAAAFSQQALKHIDTIKTEIAKLEGAGKLGVVASRWNQFLNEKPGTGDPAFNQLRDNFSLLRSAVARVHGGARGGSSPYMMEYMKNLADTGKMDPNILKSSLGVFQDWLEGYASMAPKGSVPRSQIVIPAPLR